MLLADKSKIIRDTLSELLSRIEGISKIVNNENANVLLQNVMELQPDIIVMDISFPNTDGIALVQEIKQKNPKQLIIVFTSYSFPQYRNKCSEAGADYFLDKSKNFVELVKIIKGITSQTKKISTIAL